MSENSKSKESNSLGPELKDALTDISNRLRGDFEQQLSQFAKDVNRETQTHLKEAIEQFGDNLRRTERRVQSEGGSDLDEASALNDQAVQLFYRDEMDQAAIFLENATKKNPGSVEIWNNLGMVYTTLNRSEKALHAFEKAVDLNPDHADLLNSRGVLAMIDGGPEQALGLLEEANDQHQHQIPILLNLARAHESLGHYSRAIQVWKLTMAIDPGQEEAKQNLRRYYQ